MSNNSITQPIIIIGMHRSGTSLVTKVLSELGVHIGDELDGHNESLFFQKINIALLQNSGSYWANPFPFLKKIKDPVFLKESTKTANMLTEVNTGSYGIPKENQAYAWKDPRNTITLPVWLKLYPKARVIHVMRNGIDTALSLSRREKKAFLKPSDVKRMTMPSFRKAFKLWEIYIKTAFCWEKKHSSWLTIRYEDLLEKPKEELKRLTDFIPEASGNNIEKISQHTIKHPTQRSNLEKLSIITLKTARLIDTSYLESLGYKSFENK